jgi:predicted Rossmann-fold nucleotide-binding protein
MKPRPWRQRCTSEEITSEAILLECLAPPAQLRGRTIQGLDLSEHLPALEAADLQDAIFLGCTFGDSGREVGLIKGGAAIFPRINGLPYDPYRSSLYTVSELMEGQDAGGYPATRDFKIYEHFDRARRRETGVGLRETLAQRLHDHAVDDALEELLTVAAGRGVIAIMGGHGTRRSDPYFHEVARLAWSLTRAGYFVATGGGPGIMEAGNLGAFFASYSDPVVLEDVITTLSEADTFSGEEEEGTQAYLDAIRRYFKLGQEVWGRFTGDVDPATATRYGREGSEPGQSLAIPTWFYGHEPSNLWSTHVAKYFSNSLREDGLLAIATAGVVFAPGSAGTMQEVFMDLAQNHYATFRYRSPMVFLGRERWSSLFSLVHEFVDSRGASELYGDMIGLVDDSGEALSFLEEHQRRLRESKPPLYELLESEGLEPGATK